MDRLEKIANAGEVCDGMLLQQHAESIASFAMSNWPDYNGKTYSQDHTAMTEYWAYVLECSDPEIDL